mmetsp:Transcript_139148/g.444577  ORF Transcript_139148/g.444577 Transcript_139148/m.444577 type:complete len:226 (+) Transcript_139148:3090-3767(+)
MISDEEESLCCRRYSCQMHGLKNLCRFLCDGVPDADLPKQLNAQGCTHNGAADDVGRPQDLHIPLALELCDSSTQDLVLVEQACDLLLSIVHFSPEPLLQQRRSARHRQRPQVVFDGGTKSCKIHGREDVEATPIGPRKLHPLRSSIPLVGRPVIRVLAAAVTVACCLRPSAQHADLAQLPSAGLAQPLGKTLLQAAAVNLMPASVPQRGAQRLMLAVLLGAVLR